MERGTQERPYVGRHRAEAGSDLPKRGEGVREVDASRKPQKTS